MKYCLVDMSNLVFRARYAIRSSDPADVVGMATHIALCSMLKVYEKFGASKMLCMFDSGSWRKVVYPEYKAHRRVDQKPEDVRIEESIFELIGTLHDYLKEQTNVFTLKARDMEADDFIARWIQRHPDDEHVILSCDSDFRQLISPKVELFDGMRNVLYRHDGIFFQDGKNPKKTDEVRKLYREQWKVKVDKNLVPEVVDPAWYLFEKVMRGDKSDNISPVVKPYFQTTKIRSMYEDLEQLATFLPEVREDLEHKPTHEELYMRNSELIDMTLLPDWVVERVDGKIQEELEKPNVSMIGLNLLRFCKRYELNNVSGNAHNFANMLAA